MLSSSEKKPFPQQYSESYEIAEPLFNPPFEDDLSESELRELYDNEEIERFLTIFSLYVTEVRAHEVDSHECEPPEPASSDTPFGSCPDVQEEALPGPENWSLLNFFISQCVVPILPPPRLSPPPFTIGGLRSASRRLYLAIEPVYIPFFSRMLDLAMWKDRRTSLLYCSIFWILWYNDLLLPTLMLRILCSLVRRRILPYPTLAELRNHRQQVSRAAEFGDHISAQITASTSFGVRDMWRLLKTFHKTTKSNPKDPSQHLDGSQDRYIPNPEGILEDKGDSQETKDLKRTGVLVLNQVADLHERVTNIFLWRRPASSRIYSAVILCLLFVTLLLPTRVLSKLSYLVGGALFWHVTPVIAALPSTASTRIPPILWDVPTDAEYAMELIAARVAAGQDVNPPKVRGHGTRHTAGGTENYTGLRNSKNYSENKSKSVDWKKWGERAAISKTWVENGKHLLRGRKNQASVGSDAQKRMAVPVAPEHATAMITEIPQSSMTKTTSSILSELAADHEAGSPQFVEAHSESFPAQHSSGPGLITLTATILLFTPLMSNIPKFVISLMRLRGVKKMGLLKGLQMKFSSDDGLQEIEEKFRWVGGRDELFARLVGTGKRQWLMPQ